MNNDLISREALKKSLKSNCDLCHDKNTNWCEHCCPLNDFEDLIDNAPAVDALKDITEVHCNITKEQLLNELRPQGEWIIVSRNCWKCPYCQELTNEGKNFCGNCGAKMKGGAE